jgi:hypothetical protein
MRAAVDQPVAIDAGRDFGDTRMRERKQNKSYFGHLSP